MNKNKLQMLDEVFKVYYHPDNDYCAVTFGGRKNKIWLLKEGWFEMRKEIILTMTGNIEDTYPTENKVELK